MKIFKNKLLISMLSLHVVLGAYYYGYAKTNNLSDTNIKDTDKIIRYNFSQYLRNTLKTNISKDLQDRIYENDMIERIAFLYFFSDNCS